MPAGVDRSIVAHQQTSHSLAEPSAEIPAEPSGGAGVDSLAGGSLRVQVSFPAASLAPQLSPHYSMHPHDSCTLITACIS